MTHVLERTAFSTSRLMEFFTEKELSMQIGYTSDRWPIALVKELIDNALDACENAGIPPQIEITVEADSVSVRDNGPGLPGAILEKSLDYMVRVSDKNHYVSPTRGQLGNALKCVWAAPFVIDGEQGRVEVITGGQLHRIDVTLDRLAQAPKLGHTLHPDGLVKNGTLVKMYWPQIASSLEAPPSPYFYKINLGELVSYYAAFNPHASFKYQDKGFEPTCPAWQKWQPNNPTSPHWYTMEKLRALIAANVSAELEGGRVKTVREFISELAGLSGTAKQKSVTESAGLSGAYLHDLIKGDDIDQMPVMGLLAAMQAESRPVKPTALGEIGEAHFTGWMAGHYCDPESVKYKRVMGEADGLPFVLEVALGVHTEEYEQAAGDRIIGLNWTPMLAMPLANLPGLLDDNRVDAYDPIQLAIHLTCPRLEFTDRGKSRLSLPEKINAALESAIKTVSAKWKEAKRQADRENRVYGRQLKELRKAEKRRQLSVKEAAYWVMEKAYMLASSNNTLPANARQVMYAARRDVIELTGKTTPWKKSSYFTQHLLPDFVDAHPELTADWDVVYDARGKLVEPHTKKRIDMGTLAVRRYIGDWTGQYNDLDAPNIISLPYRVETTGPINRYRYVLFVEKEGFNELFEKVQLPGRYDLAIMSTKGMSVTAARQLVADLSQRGVTILVLHDFDKAGLSIVHTLRTNTRRWQYSTPPNVIDLGLRLADVQEMNLQSEPVEYSSNVHPSQNLIESGANYEEYRFLVSKGYPGHWLGERVELNAMISEQLIAWLERKLQSAGVEKFIPDEDVLAAAYRRAKQLAKIQKSINKSIANLQKGDISIPPNLPKLVSNHLQGQSKSWDDAIFELAQKAK